MLKTRVLTFHVFSDDDKIDICKSRRGSRDCFNRDDVGKQIQFLSQLVIERAMRCVDGRVKDTYRHLKHDGDTF